MIYGKHHAYLYKMHRDAFSYIELVSMMNPEKIRKDFPLLEKRKIIYFDNACTTLKPKSVIEAVTRYYSEYSGCAGRSMHKLGKEAENAFESSRKRIAEFVCAKEHEIVFTKNTSEALNLVCRSVELNKCRVLTTVMEHHSVLLPLQQLANEGKITLDYAMGNEQGEISEKEIAEKMTPETRAVFIHHTSNVTGTGPKLKEIIKIAHDNNALAIIDAAQGAPHSHIDVKQLGADFLAFSGHKMLGPTGIGCLYGKYELLDKMKPFMLGGETITHVSLDNFTLEKPPHKFEAGIQHYAGAIGLAAACSYLEKLGMANIEQHEKQMADYIGKKLAETEGIKLYGPAQKSCPLFAFGSEKIGPHEIAIMLDEMENIAVRSGVFCAEPGSARLGMKQGAVRASLYLYNTKQEIDIFIEALGKILKTFS
jgi:cysteine desulfurase/selenocysteine lyase